MLRFVPATAMAMAGALALWACDPGPRAEVAELHAKVAEQAAAIEALTRRIDELEARQSQASSERLRRQASLLGGSTEPAAPAPTIAPAPPLSLQCAENHCTVTRAELEAALAAPSFARQARVVPATKEGVTVGFKVYAVRPSSALAQLGLKNGDMVRAIAGFELKDVETVLELPAKLRGLDRWTIAGERQGEPFEITVEVKG